MTLLRPLAVALVTLALAPAWAADSQGLFAVKGVGRATCDVFIAEREARSPAFAALLGWLDGYLTAANRYAPETYDLTSFETSDLLVALIDQHCRRNPNHSYAAVVQALIERLDGWRIAERSPSVTVAGAEREHVLYLETVRRLQRLLAERGLYTGDVDGVFGPATRRAVAGFQRASGLEASGEPDQLTLLRLFHAGE